MRIAAVLTAVAVVAVAGCSKSTGGDGKPGGPTVALVCSAATGDVGQDKSALTDRLKSLGADVVGIDTTGSTITLRVRGVAASTVRPLCTRGQLTMRPLVAAVPGTKADCGAPDTTTAPSAPLVACDTEGQRYRFAAAIVVPNDLSAADAVAPSANGSGWTVAITLTSGAAKRFGTYTAAHNANGQSSASSASMCGAASVPCADYLGFVVDGVAVSVPLTLAPITGGVVQIAGSFTRLSTHLLATQISSGELPVPLKFVSVK